MDIFCIIINNYLILMLYLKMLEDFFNEILGCYFYKANIVRNIS